MAQKIHCELTEEQLDTLSSDEIRNTIGWVEYDTKDKKWDVNTRDEGLFRCETQESAHIMANTEMILEILLRE